MIIKSLSIAFFAVTLSATAMAQTASPPQSLVYYEHQGDLVQVDCQPRKPELVQAWQELCTDIERRLIRAGFTRQSDLNARWNQLDQQTGAAGCSVTIAITAEQYLLPLPVCYYGDQKRGQEVLAKTRLVIPRN